MIGAQMHREGSAQRAQGFVLQLRGMGDVTVRLASALFSVFPPVHMFVSPIFRGFRLLFSRFSRSICPRFRSQVPESECPWGVAW